MIKNIAIKKSAATRDNALWTTFRWNTTINEVITSKAASTKNRISAGAITFRKIYCKAMITIPVIATFRSASGSIIFQPSRMT